MLRLNSIIGYAGDAELVEALHRLDHAGRVEHIVLSGDDMLRRRLHVTTDRGTECAIALPRAEQLRNGAVLLLDAGRAILVRLEQQQWLVLLARDPAAALQLGYFAGNMHWPVRFDADRLHIALHGPEEHYLDRLAHLMAEGRVWRASHG